MRISFFVPKCTPDNSHGRYVIELAKRLGVHHPVAVCSGAFWPPLRALVTCRWLPVPNRPAVARLAALWTASGLVARRGAGDVVHIQGADAPVGNVVTAHCCNSAMRAAAGRVGLRRSINYAIGARAERHCMSKSSTRKIIAVSGKVKTEIERRYGVDPNNVVVIPNGVDLEAFHPLHRVRWRGPVRERLGLGGDEFVVTFVGRDYRLKGLLPLMAAAACVPVAVRILAVGVEPDAALLSLVRHNSLKNRVTFVGKAADIAPLYAAADCFVTATRYDTFSMATLEAMACGLPVIVSRAAGVTELLTPDRDALVLEDASDINGLAQYLRWLVEDEALRADLGREGRRTAERHSWDRVAERTLAVYRQTLAEG